MKNVLINFFYHHNSDSWMKFQASSYVLLFETGHWTTSQLPTIKTFDISLAFRLSDDDNFLGSNKQINMD